MSTIAIIIPCFNEVNRLDTSTIQEWISQRPTYTFFFVNDGSTDKTGEFLSLLSTRLPERIHYIESKRNYGKAEAVRKGILHALQFPFEYIGYLDADLSTPLEEFERLTHLIQKKTAIGVLGARIKKAGVIIKRSHFRHITGRIIATIIDLRFQLDIYDTQCGAKVFAASAIKDIVQERFRTKWFFDVELFLRLKKMDKLQIHEEPLLSWQDKNYSKLNFFSFPMICKELATLLWNY